MTKRDEICDRSYEDRRQTNKGHDGVEGETVIDAQSQTYNHVVFVLLLLYSLNPVIDLSQPRERPSTSPEDAVLKERDHRCY